MKKIFSHCKELFPLLPSVLVIILVVSALVTAQSETLDVKAFNPAPITLTETSNGAKETAKTTSKTKKPDFKAKELPEKTVSSNTNKKKPAAVTFTEGGTYKDGTYTGSGTGFGGTIGVKVTIKNGKISTISVTQASGETGAYFTRAKQVLSSILSKQSPNVDTVSGATYSSTGLINAVKAALNKARTDGKKEETSAAKETKKSTKDTKKTTKDTKKKNDTASSTGKGDYKDGTWTGAGTGFGGPINVKVTIKNGKISKITILNAKNETTEFFNKAKNILPVVIKAQSTDVDTISGATYSSEGILEAITNALKKASKTSSSEKNKEKDTESAKETTSAKETKSARETESAKETDSARETESANPQETSGEKDSSDTETGTGETQAPALQYNNGTWTGTAVCDNYNYTVTASVVIDNDVIQSIDITTNDTGGNSRYISLAVNGTTKRGKHIPSVPEQIISNQSLSGIDAVSGATYSSEAIIEAVQNALEKARK